MNVCGDVPLYSVAVQIYVNLYLNILLATVKRVSHLFTKRVEILKTWVMDW
jgi:hypothetical protein